MLVWVIISAFFLHNCLESTYYDLLHINKTLRIYRYEFYIQDIFPYYDAPETGIYGETIRFDAQEYVWRVSVKVILLLGAISIYLLVNAFNVLAADLPGRTFVRMPKIMLLVIGLFAYDLGDFIFFAGQTSWKIEAIVFYSLLSGIVLWGNRKRDAKLRQ